MPIKKNERFKIVEATAKAVGELLTNTFDLLDLNHAIKLSYERGQDKYRLTFEKLPKIQEPPVKRELKPKK